MDPLLDWRCPKRALPFGSVSAAERIPGIHACECVPPLQERWVTGDFNGDGAGDLAVVQSERIGSRVSLNVTRILSDRRGGWVAGTTGTVTWDCPMTATCFSEDSSGQGTSLDLGVGDLTGDGRDSEMAATRPPTAARCSTPI